MASLTKCNVGQILLTQAARLLLVLYSHRVCSHAMSNETPLRMNGSLGAMTGFAHAVDDNDCEAVVGSLDVVAVRALADEVLIGNSRNPAYLANVCVADEARRRRVGSALIEGARRTARQWGAATRTVCGLKAVLVW